MINNRRDEIDILEQIIITCSKKSSKTRIYYESRLSHEKFQKYFDFLFNNNLIEQCPHNGKTTSYVRTEQGENALNQIKELKKVFGCEKHIRERS